MANHTTDGWYSQMSPYRVPAEVEVDEPPKIKTTYTLHWKGRPLGWLFAFNASLKCLLLMAGASMMWYDIVALVCFTVLAIDFLIEIKVNKGQ